MLKFNVFDAPLEYDDSDPDGFHAGMDRFGPKIGASKLGASVYELPPGQALCPYHYESDGTLVEWRRHEAQRLFAGAVGPLEKAAMTLGRAAGFESDELDEAPETIPVAA